MGGDMTGQRPFRKGDYEKLGGEDCIFFSVGYFSGFGVWFWMVG
jgi:hypothetical protein